MRNSWTDDRLDDGFERVHGDIALLRSESKEEAHLIRAEVNSLRQEANEGFGALHRTLFQVGGGIVAALIGIIATLIGVIATPL